MRRIGPIQWIWWAVWQRSVMRARWLPRWIRYPHWVGDAAQARNWVAASGFEALGDMAQSAVPELVQIFEQRISDDSVCATAMALAGIGPGASNAIPMFLRAATNGDARTRVTAVMALGAMQVEPRLVVPVLSSVLCDTNWYVRAVAAEALGSRGEQAREAAPALVVLLKDANADVRVSATWALTQIDPAAAARAGINTNLPGK